MNAVQLSGRIVEIQSQRSREGDPVLYMEICTDRTYTMPAARRRVAPTIVAFTLYKERAEQLAAGLAVGDEVSAEGWLSCVTFRDRHRNRRHKIFLNIATLELCRRGQEPAEVATTAEVS